MEINKIKKIKKICDSLLIFYNNNYFIRILPSLHIVNEHPINTDRYRDVINNKKIKIIFNCLYSFLIYFYKSILNLFKKKYNPNDLLVNLENKYDNIFISHLVKKDIDQDNDFYFKQLPFLSSKQSKTLVLLIDHNDIASNNRKRIIKKNYTNLILSNNLSIYIKIKIFFKSINIFLKIIKNIFYYHSLEEKIVMLNTLSTIFRNNTQLTFNLSYQFEIILNKLQPKNIFFTYEGYAWEKSLILLTKTKLKQTKTIGLQHSRLFPKLLSKTLDKLKEFEPSIILTSGDISHDLFQKYKIYSNIIKIGKPENKFKSYNSDTYNLISKNISVCVLPEGITDECYNFLKFIINSSTICKDINFIIRFHPLTNFKNLNKKINLNQKFPNNIIFSKLDLIDDLKRSNFAIYRGSSSILNAIKNGLVPIYLQLENEIDISIVNSQKYWHLKVKNSNELIYQIKNFSFNDNLNLKKDLLDYYNNYYSSFNGNKFLKLLK